MKQISVLMLGLGLSLINPVFAQNSEKSAALSSTEVGTLATIAAIDKAEVLISVVAENKKTDSGIDDFAKMMIAQHGDNLTQILQMIKNANIKSLSGGMSDQIAAESKKDLINLGGLNEHDFSIAYINAMVKGHQDALNLIDNKLLKTAKSDEMKKFMTDTRNTVAKHLEDARKLQENMKS